MSSVKTLNPKAEVMGRSAALFMNINAAKGLRDVMKTNLGPKGTIKMLVGGAGGNREACCSACSRCRSKKWFAGWRRYAADGYMHDAQFARLLQSG